MDKLPAVSTTSLYFCEMLLKHTPVLRSTDLNFSDRMLLPLRYHFGLPLLEDYLFYLIDYHHLIFLLTSTSSLPHTYTSNRIDVLVKATWEHGNIVFDG